MPSPTGMQIYDPQGHRLYLTGSERAAFRTAAEAAPREVRTYCWTLLYTGCRPSEALALTADRVDFQAAVLTFESQEETPPWPLPRRARPGHAPGCPRSGAWPPRPRHPHVSLDVEPENRYTRVIEIMARAGIAGKRRGRSRVSGRRGRGGEG